MKEGENLSLGNKKAYQTHPGFSCEKDNNTGLTRFLLLAQDESLSSMRKI